MDLTQDPYLEKTSAIMKNVVLNLLFSQIVDENAEKFNFIKLLKEKKSKAIKLSIGIKLLEKFIIILIKADEFGDEMYSSFVNGRLIKGKAYFFDPVKKVNLDIGSKETKNIPKTISVMKEYKQALGVTLCEKVNLEEVFWYPVTPVPLNLTYPDSNIKRNIKHDLRDSLIVYKASDSTTPNKAR